MNPCACANFSDMAWPTGTAENRPPANEHEFVSQTPDQARDVELLRLISQGDASAFAEFYDRYSTLLFSLAFKILREQKEAEDVLQEVFLQIWAKAANYDSRLGCPSSWAVVLTRNKAIDHVRALQRRGRLLEGATAEAGTGAGGNPGTANETVCGREQAEMIRSSVSGLPADQRAAIELAFFSGLTHQEIAEKLQEPPGTIKARIRRGLMKLREVLEDIL